MINRRARFALGAIPIVFGLTACGSSATTSGAQEHDADLWMLMNQLAVDFEYHETLEALWKDSDAAVIGHMKNVREGRGLGGKKGEDVTTETVIVTFQVTELVRGDLNEDSRRIVISNYGARRW